MLKRIEHERAAPLRPSSVRVRIVSAIVPRGDILSESDTYIIVRFGQNHYLTKTIRNDRSPEFDETLFDSEALGYRYDKLPTLQPPQMRAQPIVAAFRGIDITPLRGKSVELHVFVFEKGRMFLVSHTVMIQQM